jgi:hypothetical protein
MDAISIRYPTNGISQLLKEEEYKSLIIFWI